MQFCLFGRGTKFRNIIKMSFWMIGGSIPGVGWEFFSSPPRPDRLWGPTQTPIRWKLTTHLHLMSRSRICGSYTFIPQYAFIAWWSVQNKEQGQLYL
jgi:hypothetical protein